VTQGGPLDGWTTDAIPDLTGSTAVVTGVTGGLGDATVRELARHGARVVATARDATRGEATLQRIRADVPDADIELVLVDLADLASVREAGAATTAAHPRIDIVVNNAGVMAVPRARTVDGFEWQMGTNHLGHFAWTGLLWPSLAAAAGRVVAVSSQAHRMAPGIPARALRRDDGTSSYRRWRAYARSKLANLVWMVELDRRMRAMASTVTCVAAHPGYASTGLFDAGPGQDHRLVGTGLRLLSRLVGQSAEHGAWPLVAAATTPQLPGGSYVGPGALNQARGRPTLVGMAATAQDPALGKLLWDLSEQATGVRYP